MKVRIIALILLLAGAGIGFFVYSSEGNTGSRFPFKLGLDLAGGTLLTYQADVSQVTLGEVDDAMGALRDVIERRVNLFGVSEPVVQVERPSVFAGGENTNEVRRLIVELPGVTDVNEAIALIGRTPLLEFKLRTGDLSSLQGLSPEDLEQVDIDSFYTATGLTGRFLQRAQLQFGGGGQTGLSNEAVVLLDFNGEGKALFADITREHVGEILAIFLDGVPISEPVIQTEIPDGTAVISGNFNPEEARELVRNLNFGALPVPITLIGTQNIGAALGDEILVAGVRAGAWGLALVIIFLIFWYRLPGLVAALSLGIYIALMLALFKLIPVTLTAAGIAGFVLSIGMAVDANILIFERVKEELRGGRALVEALREGFARAWLSIRDGNLSSIITAVILFWLGTSLVEGFALTFGIGVLVSMITAITVTRVLLLAAAQSESEKVSTFLFGTGLK